MLLKYERMVEKKTALLPNEQLGNRFLYFTSTLSGMICQICPRERYENNRKICPSISYFRSTLSGMICHKA